jgi:hypothetical protein
MSLDELQKWYVSQCDGDWEHTYGLAIGTLDNPGWSLKVDLAGTALEGKPFAGFSYGVGKDAVNSGDDWIDCKVKDNRFLAFGGPQKLKEMIDVFLRWVRDDS